MKRVYCLYRVSTKKQVDKNENDIPMQTTACHEFAGRQADWVIQREFSEKGISGYKVSAQDRDAIQDLKEAALKDEFDILLVFMFDRIGRIDDETPFVVEWFAKHGIEVWSTREGQQRFDSHVDKLINYLRFWQASGESEKTSIRISSKMQQMQMDGMYTGGPVKFGYCLVDGGLVNRKGAPIRKYEIDPAEKEILELIDELTVNKGYGAWRLATIHYTDSYERADGSVYCVDQVKYSCYHKSRKLCPCDGQTTYQAEKVDGMVSQTIREIFKSMSGAPEEEKIQDLFQRRIAGNRAMQKKLNFELGKHREQLTKLQMEIAKTLTGDSLYSPEDLTQAIQTVKKRIEESEIQLERLKAEETQKKQGVEMVTPAYKQFKSWAEEFDSATLEQKKMIACQLLRRVEVGRDYKISVELNMTYSQFCNEWNANEFLGTLLHSTDNEPKENILYHGMSLC